MRKRVRALVDLTIGQTLVTKQNRNIIGEIARPASDHFIDEHGFLALIMPSLRAKRSNPGVITLQSEQFASWIASSALPPRNDNRSINSPAFARSLRPLSPT